MIWWLPFLGFLAAPAAPETCRPHRVCEVTMALSPVAAEALLGDRDQAWWINGDRLTIVARREGEATLCCAIQRRLHPIGRGLQAVSVRIPDIDSAMFDVDIVPNDRQTDAPVWRGPTAPSAPDQAMVDRGRFSDHAFDSAALGRRRGIVVYVPPGLAQGQRVPTVYMADSMATQFAAIAQASVGAGRSRPVILVGIANGGTTPDPSCAPRCDPRSQEYLIDIPDATPAESRFEAHARFVLDEVIPYVESHYPALRGREARATMGYSSGGAWAVTMAALHPETFGGAIGLSIGWLPAAQRAPGLGRARVFLAAGRLESDHFIERTNLAADLARRAGAEVRLRTLNGGHAFALWDIAFADALAWLFPPAPQ